MKSISVGYVGIGLFANVAQHLAIALISIASIAANAQTIPGALPDSAAALRRGEWAAYAGTYAAARYSPLTQIDAKNATHPGVVWRWKSPDHAIKDGNPKVGPTRTNESTPVMVGGTLYTSTSLSQVAAIDAATGETKWVFDPKVYENGLGIPANNGWLHRGVAYWRSGDDERVVILTAFAHMIALDARTGKPVPTFGTDGWVDLAQGLRGAKAPPLHSWQAVGIAAARKSAAVCHRTNRPEQVQQGDRKLFTSSPRTGRGSPACPPSGKP
jgi:glucose dehydrogenase